MKRRVLLASTAAAALSSEMVNAQQKAMVIGYLHGGAPGSSAPDVAGFRQGLDETGYVEGQNVSIEYRWAEGRYDRLPALAADLVERKVGVIAAIGGPPVAHAAKNATSTIPIVFVSGRDPVADGLVASLARPGGNVTGISIFVVELNPKRFELLHELVPEVKVIAQLENPTIPPTEHETRGLLEAAQAKGVQLHILKASNESAINAAFATLVQRQAGALLVATDAFFLDRREQITALALRHSMPTISGFREFATAGGLISYGPSLPAFSRQAGIYAGKILKGAKPAELPVLQPTTFELVINLKTAKALGLTIPPSFLSRADEVIE